MFLKFIVRDGLYMLDIEGALKFCLPHCGFFARGKIYVDGHTFGPRCEWASKCVLCGQVGKGFCGCGARGARK